MRCTCAPKQDILLGTRNFDIHYTRRPTRAPQWRLLFKSQWTLKINIKNCVIKMKNMIGNFLSLSLSLFVVYSRTHSDAFDFRFADKSKYGVVEIAKNKFEFTSTFKTAFLQLSTLRSSGVLRIRSRGGGGGDYAYNLYSDVTNSRRVFHVPRRYDIFLNHRVIR